MSLRVDLFRVEDLEAVLAGLVLHGDGAPLRSDVAVLPGDLSRAVGLLLAAVLLLVAGGRVREGGGGVLQQYDISGGRHEDKKVLPKVEKLSSHKYQIIHELNYALSFSLFDLPTFLGTF